MKVELVNLFPNLSKLLYLDGDICVVGDLAPIWYTDISKHFLAATENPFFMRHEEIGINQESLYFNSGVMLLNLDKMRQKNFYDEAHRIIETQPHKLMFHDQDTFNMVVNGNFINLPNIYNFQTFLIRKIHRYDKTKRKEIYQQFKSAVIIHYSSGIKPWRKYDPHPLSFKFKQFYDFPIEGNQSLITNMKEFLRFLYVKAYYFIFLKLGI
jgi:lipopolysaccharide biosynthesis glycosyltransferase